MLAQWTDESGSLLLLSVLLDVQNTHEKKLEVIELARKENNNSADKPCVTDYVGFINRIAHDNLFRDTSPLLFDQ